MTEHDILKDIPEHLLTPIVHYITGFHNLTDHDVNEAILKPALSDIYILFIIQYGVLALVGIVANLFIIYYIFQHKLYHDETHAFMVNLCCCHLVQCMFVLPVTLMVILIQNWIFGQFMCYFVPLLQVSDPKPKQKNKRKKWANRILRNSISDQPQISIDILNELMQ